MEAGAFCPAMHDGDEDRAQFAASQNAMGCGFRLQDMFTMHAKSAKFLLYFCASAPTSW